MTHIQKISSVGRGHFQVVVEEDHFQRKYPYRITSITSWTHITTNTTAIDDYRSDDEKRHIKGRKKLIYEAKAYGAKTITKYNR